MKKIFYQLPIILLMMSIFVACSPDDLPEPPSDDTVTYEVISDVQVPINYFLASIPAEYAAFKEPLEGAFALRESALEQVLGTDIQIGFRKVAYTYPSTDVKGNTITLSAVAFWLGYFEGNAWNDLQPDNICLMEHYTITSDAETPSNAFALEMFITGNALTIMPDYIGYGVTK